MTNMRRRWIIPVLAIGLVATSVWGYSQFRARQGYELQAENDFQRAFHELTFHIDGMDNLLAKASVVNSTPQLNRVFTDIWRHCYSAQQNLAQLPLTNVDLTSTRNFLAKLLSFSYRVSNQAVEGQKLNEKDWKTARQFKDQSAFLTDELQQMQAYVFDSAVRWVDETSMEMAAALGIREGNPGNLTKNFIMVEDGLRRLPDPSFDGNTLNIKARPTGLTGANITATQAIERARAFLAPRNLSGYTFDVTQRQSTDLPGYIVEGRPPRGDARNVIRMDVTRKGGHVLWMLEERSVDRPKIKVNQAIDAGRRFLDAKGYRNLSVAMFSDYQNIAVITYVPVVNGTYVYPDMIKVQVARDNGQVLAFDASSYLTFHKMRQGSSEKMSMEKCKEKLNHHLKVERSREAIILDDQFKEIHCYEFEGTIGRDRFLVYLNVQNGQEEKIRRITETGVEEL